MVAGVTIPVFIRSWANFIGNLPNQCSAKALEKWGQMTPTTCIKNYGDIGNFSGVIYVILPFVNLKFVGTWAPTAKMIGDIPDFNVLIVPKTQPRHNPAQSTFEIRAQMNNYPLIIEVPYLIETHTPKWFVNCSPIVVPPQNGSTPVNVLALGTPNTNFA